jgi:large subunit ribosomal protein L15
MLKLNDLQPAEGSRKNRQRVGRGNGSGWGKTAQRGHNGAKSRSGYSQKLYFEGGQLPLIRRLPKRGFTNIFKKSFQIINISDINDIAATNEVIDAAVLFAAGKIHSIDEPIKVLGNGTLEKGVTVKAEAFSKSAEEKISNAKGKVEVTARA